MKIPLAEKAFRKSQCKEALGLIVAEKERNKRGGQNRIHRILDQNIEIFSPYFMYVTGGTYEGVIWNNKGDEGEWNPQWPSLDGFRLRAGKSGGLVEMASRIESYISDDDNVIEGPIKVLILIADPEDFEEAHPEVRTLIRCAIRNNIIFLPTHSALSHWIKYETGGAAKSEPEDDAVALIAHDGMKIEMCRWVVENRDELKKFRRIVTTGTTGKLIGDFLDACKIPSEKICRMYSGPKGGDVQIAEEIMSGEIQHVIFFIDPMRAHPHESDIQTLFRICELGELNVNLRITERGATSWIRSYTLDDRIKR
jgi:methylglyoxal synthase